MTLENGLQNEGKINSGEDIEKQIRETREEILKVQGEIGEKEGLIEETKEKRKKKDLEGEKAQLMQKEIDLGRVVSSLLSKLEKKSSVVLDSEKKTNDEKILTKSPVKNPVDIIESDEALEKRPKILEVYESEAQKIEKENLKEIEKIENSISMGKGAEVEQEEKKLSLQYPKEEIPVIKLEDKVPEKEENPTTPEEEGEIIEKLKKSILTQITEKLEEIKKTSRGENKENIFKKFWHLTDPVGGIKSKKDAVIEALKIKKESLLAEAKKISPKKEEEITEWLNSLFDEKGNVRETTFVTGPFDFHRGIKQKEELSSPTPEEVIKKLNKITKEEEEDALKIEVEENGNTVSYYDTGEVESVTVPNSHTDFFDKSGALTRKELSNGKVKYYYNGVEVPEEDDKEETLEEKRENELDQEIKKKENSEKEEIESIDKGIMEDTLINILKPITQEGKDGKQENSLQITESNKKLILNAKIKMRLGFSVDVLLDGIEITNLGDTVDLEKNYLSKVIILNQKGKHKEIIEERVKDLLAEKFASFNVRLVETIGKEKNKIVEKIWIEDGQLKAKYKKIGEIPVVPVEKIPEPEIKEDVKDESTKSIKEEEEENKVANIQTLEKQESESEERLKQEKIDALKKKEIDLERKINERKLKIDQLQKLAEMLPDEFLPDYIEQKILSLLQKYENEIEIVKKPEVIGTDKEITINAVVNKYFYNIKINVVIGNKQDGIEIKKHEIECKSKKIKKRAEDLLLPQLAKISELLKNYIEEEKGKEVERIWIEDGVLMASYKQKETEKDYSNLKWR